MADTFIAVSDIRHGDGDKVKQFTRKDTVKGLPADVMRELWAAGALAVKGTPADPNMWPEESGPATTTPRFVEDVLLAEVGQAGAPAGADVPSTQGEVPKDPEGLLKGNPEASGSESEPPEDEAEAAEKQAEANENRPPTSGLGGTA